LRGLRGTQPLGQSSSAALSDPWREIGRQAVAAPLILAGGGLSALTAGSGREALMSLMLNSGIYSALQAGSQRLGGLLGNSAPPQ
jgi:hypothetical protein